MRPLGIALLLGALSALALLPVAAQEPSEVRVIDVDASKFPVLKVVIEAEQAGRPLPELPPSDLLITDEGLGVDVTSVEQATDASLPLHVVFALDVSGSMAGERMSSAQDSAAAFVDRLRSQDQAALVSFGNVSRIEQPFGAGRDGLAQAIRALLPGGNTALFDAVQMSADVARQAGEGRRAVVLLSDGEDSGGVSTTTREHSIAAARESGALFYVIGLEGGVVDQGYLTELASSTGGAYFASHGASDLPRVYQQIEERLRSQFVVTGTSSSNSPAPERELRVSLRAGGATASTTITYAGPPAPPAQVTTEEPATPETPAIPTASDQAQSAAEGSGRSSLTLALLGLVLLAALGAGAFVVFGRRRAEGADGFQGPEARPVPAEVERVEVQQPLALGLARLVPRGGGSAIRLGSEPVTFGSGPSCVVRMPAVPGVGALHARVWRGDGRTMLHHVAKGGETRVNGSPVDWVSLADGDVVAFGPFEYRFEVAAQELAIAAPAAGS